jgi:Protein kinase domain/Nuclease-related domain
MLMTTDYHDNDNRKKQDRHVTFCAEADFAVKGIWAEWGCVQFLLNTLDVETVGDYHLLVNYNVMERGGNSLEVDMVVINRLGIFLLEIKDWHGSIEASDDVWVFRSIHERKNPWKSIDRKARIFHSQLFEKRGPFSHLSQVSVIGIVVLTQGLNSFVSHGRDNTQRIVDLSPRLTNVLSTHHQLHQGPRSRQLSDAEIQSIQQSLFKKHRPSDTVIRNYRVMKPLVRRDLCETFLAQHTQMPDVQVRLKRYQLPSLEQAMMEISITHFQRSRQAVNALGSHTHLLSTHDFFPDEIRHQENVFYEITELPTGPGLDEVMRTRRRLGRKITFTQQISFLESISLALQHAHNHKDTQGQPAPVYHRNICPETVFQMGDGTVKLGDFDFAKFGDKTISVPGQTLIAKPYTAPELLQNSSQASARSDIYALGVLWYFMASLPNKPKQFNPAEINTLELSEQARSFMKRMTAEKPADRPEKIEDVLEALSTYRETI